MYVLWRFQDKYIWVRWVGVDRQNAIGHILDPDLHAGRHAFNRCGTDDHGESHLVREWHLRI